MPRSKRPLTSMSSERMPRRASCTARMVPEAPPPTIATGNRSDFVVRPSLRICGAGLSLVHMVVHVRDRLAGGLGKDPWNDSVHYAGETGSDQPGADCSSADAVPSPAHPERTRMFQEHAAGQAWPLLI